MQFIFPTGIKLNLTFIVSDCISVDTKVAQNVGMKVQVLYK